MNILDECACKIATPCNGVCGTTCTGGEVSPDCVDCVNAEVATEGSTCTATAVQSCWDDASCTPFLECGVDCQE